MKKVDSRRDVQSDNLTIYDKVKKKLLNNWIVAILVIVIVSGSLALDFLRKGHDVIGELRGKVTMSVTVENGGECGPNPVSKDFENLKARSILDVGINNNSDENVMITAVRLIPVEVTGSFYAGETELSGEYDVIVDDWLNMAMDAQGYSHEGEARQSELIKAKKAWKKDGWWWVRPDYISVDEIPGRKFTVAANAADRLRVRLGLSRSVDFVLGTVKLELETDRTGKLESGPITIAVCEPSDTVSK